jgi:SET domain-containing protein 6
LFDHTDIPTRYSLETYHIMGSRILSRSFTLEKTDDAAEKDKSHASEEDAGNTSIGSAMDVDSAAAQVKEGEDAHGEEHEQEEEEQGSDDEEEVAAEVVMIPFADILNARYQTENVCWISIH